MKLLTIDIKMVGPNKKINRRLQITDDYNLNALHIAIQEMFYFNYDQEHEFEFKNIVYLPAAEHDFKELKSLQDALHEEMARLQAKDIDIDSLFNTQKVYKDDCKTTLKDLGLTANDSFDYTYDQEHNYEFVIELVQTNSAKRSKIAVIDFKGKFVPQGLDIDSYNRIKAEKCGEDYEALVSMEKEFDKKIVMENVSGLQPTTTLYDEKN